MPPAARCFWKLAMKWQGLRMKFTEGLEAVVTAIEADAGEGGAEAAGKRAVTRSVASLRETPSRPPPAAPGGWRPASHYHALCKGYRRAGAETSRRACRTAVSHCRTLSLLNCAIISSPRDRHNATRGCAGPEWPRTRIGDEVGEGMICNVAGRKLRTLIPLQNVNGET